MSKMFHVDSGIISDVGLRNFLKSLGGYYLKRMTFANPCEDTLSITRIGDTISMDHFNFMVLQLNNNINVVPMVVGLMSNFREKVVYAEPITRRYEAAAKFPKDNQYAQPPSQQVGMDRIGMPTAWGYEVGDPLINIAIVDDGIDWERCEFGGASQGGKIFGGIDYSNDDSPTTFNNRSSHGTQVASIVGALTNNNNTVTIGNQTITCDEGVVGVAGGWGGKGGDTPISTGCSLIGLRCENMTDPRQNEFDSTYIYSAILEASSLSTGGKYGMGAHVINASIYAIEAPLYTERHAVFEAYRNGVSFVAAKGNFGTNPDVNIRTTRIYPSDYNQFVAISVGGSEENKDKVTPSSWGVAVDLIAPYRPTPNSSVVLNTTVKLGTDTQYDVFFGTSASAPYVAGVVGLLRSYFKKKNIFNLEPEDYEGILKATALDRNPTTSPGITPPYSNNYDIYTGWGHLQADAAFEKLDENLVSGNYYVKHYEIKGENLSVGDFGGYEPRVFDNVGFDKSIKLGYYNAGWRSVSMYYDLPEGDFDYSKPFYVWAKGKGRYFCYSLAKPNMQEHFTDILSGIGGMSLTTENETVRGIIHSGNTTVHVSGYQYNITSINPETNQPFGHVPKDDDLGFNFSVFGSRPMASVRSKPHSNKSINIQPKNYSGLTELEIKSVDRLAKIVVYDVLGRVIAQKQFDYSHISNTIFRLPRLSSGIYFCSVISSSSSITHSFMIQQ